MLQSDADRCCHALMLFRVGLLREHELMIVSTIHSLQPLSGNGLTTFLQRLVDSPQAQIRLCVLADSLGLWNRRATLERTSTLFRHLGYQSVDTTYKSKVMSLFNSFFVRSLPQSDVWVLLSCWSIRWFFFQPITVFLSSIEAVTHSNYTMSIRSISVLCKCLRGTLVSKKKVVIDLSSIFDFS